MRLADFILNNLEPILGEWEVFARSIWPGAATNPLTLRDHAEQILRAMARDMQSAQTTLQQFDKSQGEGDAGAVSDRVTGASDLHAIGRVRSGFDLMEVISEYRALRASVIRLWRESGPDADRRDLNDLTRFNESIDQSLTEAVRSYSMIVERSRQMFLAILGHDLRNPLNSVVMSAALLSTMGEPDGEPAILASQISASANAMAGMIRDLLDFTATELGVEMPLSCAAMDLGDLCQEVVGETRAANPTRTISIAADGDLAGEWDAGRLRQVVSNLLGNAVQHGTGPVELAVGVENSGVRLAVRNDGPPIPPDAVATIFDPLVRGASADPLKRRRPGSIGLGLYIAREVVTAHGGTIDVESSAQLGTVFTVRLPRHPPRC
jgi:signal transduction histidine kinase